MKKKPRRQYELSLAAFDAAGQYERNHMLLDWMSDDEQRQKLFELINTERSGQLVFPSRDASPRQCSGAGYDSRLKPGNPEHMEVTLVTHRQQIVDILLNRVPGKRYSSRVYSELGGGNFMLALDPSDPTVDPTKPSMHDDQRKAFGSCFPRGREQLSSVAYAACQAAGVMAFRAPQFDLASFAEQAALRLCQMLMGYAIQDFALLEVALRPAYKALVYQVHGRHFTSDPTAIPQAQIMMGALLTRTSALIDAYAADAAAKACAAAARARGEPEEATRDDDSLKGCDDPDLPFGVPRVLDRLGQLKGNLNGEQRAILAVGAAIGTVGNVQAAVCIAVSAMFDQPELLAQARALAQKDQGKHPTGEYDAWQRLIAGPLRANPPIAYLPRLEVNEQGEKVKELLLALGGGTAGRSGIADGEDDPLVWGQDPDAKHNCAGRALAWPLIIEVVRQVMQLPALAQGLDPEDGTVVGLQKLRGFSCTSYPFTHRRDRWRAQTSLNVTMRIKAPVKDNVENLRTAIRCGAPQIERLLREARHVHFAWFEIIEADTVLVLHTVYDGPFGAYLQHFALQAGDLFDMLFQFIEDPPPMPVAKFPDEFAAHLLLYNRQPATGYFFSAYPRSEVAQILREQGRGP